MTESFDMDQLEHQFLRSLGKWFLLAGLTLAAGLSFWIWALGMWG